MSVAETGAAAESETREVRRLAGELQTALSAADIDRALRAIPAIGGSSHEVDAAISGCLEAAGFSGQRRDLFAGYPVSGLRPDWYRPIGTSGILLEVERGKTVANNMDLLDLWKCHICVEARHLFLIVPRILTRTAGVEQVFTRVVDRLQLFFRPGNEVNVLSAAVFGYGQAPTTNRAV